MATTSTWIEAAFVRGGTSKGLFFTDNELSLAIPDAGAPGVAELSALRRRDAVLCAALGSPDPFGRQLDGMGGGVSSLSKAVIVGRSERAGIDLDYTFAQVPVNSTEVDYSGNCGNLSSGVVPFALASGLLTRPDGWQHFSLFNINTNKVVHVRLDVSEGQAAVSGSFALPGVAGTGSLIELAYPDPGGSRTSSVLPTGLRAEELSVLGRRVRVSIVDATIPLVIVQAAEIGLAGAELPSVLELKLETMALLEELRRAGAVRVGLCTSALSAPLAIPKIAIVSPPSEAELLSGGTQTREMVDLSVRTISMERVHGAVPGTVAMCVAAAAAISGTVVAELLSQDDEAGAETQTIRIGTPSGVVTASATSERNTASVRSGLPYIAETSLARTARVLMRGQVALQLNDR